MGSNSFHSTAPFKEEFSVPASLLPRATQPLPAAISVTGEGPGPGGDTSRAELATPGQQTGGVLLLLLAPPASL